MQVSSGSYYRYVKGVTYRESSPKATLRARIKACFTENSRRYGSRRIAAALQIGRRGGARRDEAGRFAGDCPEKFQTEDDRFQTQFANQR